MTDIFYHGSRLRNLASLELKYASKETPFGPAVYVSKDPSASNCYTSNVGQIYCLKLLGDNDNTINLDETVGRQSGSAIDAIRRLSKIHYRETDILERNARDVIHPLCDDIDELYERRETANLFLRNRGIWMLYGHLDSMEGGGLCDRGVQYAVINDSFIQLLGPIVDEWRNPVQA